MFLSRLWILVSLAIGAASVDTDKYKKLGGDAVLSPSSVSDPITSITWKHGADIAVEWYGQETVEYRDFKDRCKLDFSTGALTISNLTVKDSGVYTAEINNRVMSPTEITVISAVPKPTVSTQCSSEGTRCTFTCEASITGAEPVTYYWMVDGKNITGSSKSLEKEKNDPEMVGKPISCQLKNPVSSERSDDVIPFPNSDYTGAIVGGVAGILVLLIAVAIGLVIRCRRRRGSQTLNGERTPFISQNNGFEPPERSQDDTPVQTEEGAKEPPERSQDDTPVQTEEGAEVQHEAHGEGQDPESTQTGNGDEPPERSQDDTPVQREEGAEEEEAQISMSNGTAVAYMKAVEIHNQEQNSESTQSKHEPEPPERSEDDTPGQREEGAEVQHEARGEEQDPESTQTGNGDEPPVRSQDDTPVQTEEGAEVTTSDRQEVSNEEQPEPVSTDDSFEYKHV